LHDATVVSVNNQDGAQLGTMNLTDLMASSLCEMVTSLSDGLRADLLDAQIATALLTGIVAETKRFSNEKTSPRTMTASSKLMAAGANQQLVASKLEEPEVAPQVTPVKQAPAASSDGSLEIKHDEPKPEEKPADSIHIDEHGTFHPVADAPAVPPKPVEPPAAPSRMILQPPTMGGTLTAGTSPSDHPGDETSDPLSSPGIETGRILSHDAPAASTEPPKPLDLPAPVAPIAPVAAVAAVPPKPVEPPKNDQTLIQIEQTVHSPHLEAGVGDARDAVQSAIHADVSNAAPEPIQALNAQPLGGSLQPTVAPITPVAPPATDTSATTWPSFVPQNDQPSSTNPTVSNPTAPPPVPPPMTPSIL
jgi:hypothetical protein